jgi:hypothetical protein
MRLVQIFNECGFTDILHPEHFIGLSYHTMRYILNGMVEQTRWWMYEKVNGKDPYTLRAPRAKITLSTELVIQAATRSFCFTPEAFKAAAQAATSFFSSPRVSETLGPTSE